MNIEPPSKAIPVAAAPTICYTDSEQKAEKQVIYGETGMNSHEKLDGMTYYLDQNSYELTDKLYGLKERVLKPFIKEYLYKKYPDEDSRKSALKKCSHFKKLYHDRCSVNEIISNMDISALCYLIKDNYLLGSSNTNLACRCIRIRNIEAHKGTENIKDICLISAFYVIYTASKIMLGEENAETKKFRKNYYSILVKNKDLGERPETNIQCRDCLETALGTLSEIVGFSKTGSDYYGLFDYFEDNYVKQAKNEKTIIDNMHHEAKEANIYITHNDTDPHEALYLLFALYRLAYCFDEKSDYGMKSDSIIRLYGQLYKSKILPRLKEIESEL